MLMKLKSSQAHNPWIRVLMHSPVLWTVCVVGHNLEPGHDSQVVPGLQNSIGNAQLARQCAYVATVSLPCTVHVCVQAVTGYRSG